MLAKLPLELIEIIINKLSYNEINDIFRSNMYFSGLKHLVQYTQPVVYDEIKHLSYSDNFINLKHISEDGEIPYKRSKNGKIKITSLTFGEYFDNDIDHIPNSVTHLDFGFNFNKNIIDNCIPNSVTHLTFSLIRILHLVLLS